MSLISINWKPAPRALREFGVVMLVGLGVIGGLTFWRGRHEVAYALWAFGAVSGVLGLTGTRIALPFYWGWMSIGFLLGNIVGRALIVVFFYGVITPMGLAMRLLRRDRLALRKPKTDTCWCDSPAVSDIEYYQRQS